VAITMTSQTTNSAVERPSLRDVSDARTHYQLKVHPASRRAQLALPLRTDSEEWIESSRSRQPLPPWSEFIDAVRRANEQFCARSTAGWTATASPTATGGGG
jgi:hypothetical protein